jgi:hypothetical protein
MSPRLMSSEVQSHDRRKAIPNEGTKEKAIEEYPIPSWHIGECEAQLWIFTGPPRTLEENRLPEIHWVAAESLDAALLYLEAIPRFHDRRGHVSGNDPSALRLTRGLIATSGKEDNGFGAAWAALG